MHKVYLSRPKSGGREVEHLDRVMDDLEKIRSPGGGRIYRTYVHNLVGPNYIFSTTSKDLHLTLGQMSHDGQKHLCELILQEMRANACDELLLFEPPLKRGVHVIFQLPRQGTKEVSARAVFHLSPAH